MTNRHWLKREVPAWVKEKLISEEEGKALLARSGRTEPKLRKFTWFRFRIMIAILPRSIPAYAYVGIIQNPGRIANTFLKIFLGRSIHKIYLC